MHVFKDINFPVNMSVAASYKTMLCHTFQLKYYLITTLSLYSLNISKYLEKKRWYRGYAFSSILTSQILNAFYPQTSDCQKVDVPAPAPSAWVLCFFWNNKYLEGKWWRIPSNSMCLPSSQDFLPSSPGYFSCFPIFFQRAIFNYFIHFW